MKILCILRSSIFLLALIAAHQFAAPRKTSLPPRSEAVLRHGPIRVHGMDGQLAVVRTQRPSIVGSVQLFNLTVPLNGITFDKTFLWAGQPRMWEA